jgi:hypothetical protein
VDRGNRYPDFFALDLGNRCPDTCHLNCSTISPSPFIYGTHTLQPPICLDPTVVSPSAIFKISLNQPVSFTVTDLAWWSWVATSARLAEIRTCIISTSVSSSYGFATQRHQNWRMTGLERGNLSRRPLNYCQPTSALRGLRLNHFFQSSWVR